MIKEKFEGRKIRLPEIKFCMIEVVEGCKKIIT